MTDCVVSLSATRRTGAAAVLGTRTQLRGQAGDGVGQGVRTSGGVHKGTPSKGR